MPVRKGQKKSKTQILEKKQVKNVDINTKKGWVSTPIESDEEDPETNKQLEKIWN